MGNNENKKYQGILDTTYIILFKFIEIYSHTGKMDFASDKIKTEIFDKKSCL